MSSHTNAGATEIPVLAVSLTRSAQHVGLDQSPPVSAQMEKEMVDLNRLLMESFPRQQPRVPRKRVAYRPSKSPKSSQAKAGCAKEDWHKPSERDAARYARFVDARNKRKRKRARRALRPEVGENWTEEERAEFFATYPDTEHPGFADGNYFYRACHNIMSTIYQFGQRNLFVAAQLHNTTINTPTCRDRYRAPVFAVARVIQRRVSDRVEEHQDLLPVAAAIITYLTSISYANSKEEVMRITVAVLGQHYRNISNLDFAKLLPSLGAVVAPASTASSDDVPTDLAPESDFSYRDLVRRLQDGSVALSDTPIAKFLIGVFTLLSVAGCRAEGLVEDHTAEMIDKVLKEVFPSHFRMSLVDSIFGILEFVATAIDHVRGGGALTEFVFSDHLYREICELLQEGSDVQTGFIHKKGDDYVREYRARIANAIKKVDTMTAREGKKGRSVAMFITYGIRLRGILEEITVFERNATHRLRPLAIVLVGPSSIGKSNLYGHIRGVVGNAYGKEYPDSNVAHLAPDAKYDDVIKETTEVIQIDDINALDDKNKDPSETALGKLLKMVNNEPVPTNQSVAERKDKIFFHPDLVLGSSNTYDLGILDAYKHPQAAFNRLEIVEVRIKPEFSKDGKLDVVAANAAVIDGIPAVMHDVRPVHWVPSTVVKTPGKSAPRQMDMTEGEIWQPLDKYLIELGVRARVHVSQQRALREHANTIGTKPRCTKCGSWANSQWCHCILEPEIGGSMGVVADDLQDFFLNFYISAVDMPVVGHFASWFSVTGMHLLYWFHNYIVLFVPFFISLLLFDKIIVFHLLVASLVAYQYGLMTATTFYVVVASVCLIIGSIVLAIGRYYYAIVEARALECAAHAEGVVEQYRTVPYKKIAGCLMGLVGARMIVKNLILLWQSTPQVAPQGNLMVTTPASVEERRVEKSEWDRINKRPVDLDHRLKTSTMSHVLDKINTNLFLVEYSYDVGKSKVGYCTFLDDNVAVLNKHVWRSFDNTNPLLKFSRVHSGSEFESFVTRFYEDPEDDICYLILANKPSTCGMSHLLYDGRYSGLAVLVRRLDDGTLRHDEVNLQPGKIACGAYVGILPSHGVHYTPKFPTTKGDCGLLLISANKPHAIVGMHCAGNGKNGAATYFNVQSYTRFRAWMMQVTMEPEGEFLIPICGNGDVLETQPYDEVGVVVAEEIDVRHCVNFYNCPAMNIGVCGYAEASRIKGRSDLRYNAAAPILEEKGVELVYGPPRMLADRDHSAALKDRSTPMRQINPKLLSAAMKDYLEPLLEKANDPDYRFYTKPLTLDEALNGVESTRFINQIDETTSCGFGISGKKAKLLVVEYDEETGRKILHSGSMLEARFELIKDNCRKGLRSNPLIKTAMKSEPVKYEDGAPKKNTRLFFVYPFAEFLLTKAFFAPVVEFLLNFPLISMCMGGINVNKKDWGDAFRHLAEFGFTRCIEGDYSRWDLRLSGQMIRASGAVMIHIARALGYSKEDLQAMVVMVSDLASNYVMFQGALINVEGIMISGTYLTLILNSIANALIHFCAFLSKVHEGTFSAPKGLRVRDHLRCIFMGDDSLCTSRTDGFSQLDMFDFCRNHDLEYTCGDKSAVIEPYKNLRDATFCKRSFRYCLELEEYVAPIALASIHKTLYMYKNESCITERNQIVDAMGAALYELARHPREVFEEQVEIIRQTAFELDLLHLVPHVHRSYFEWIDVLRVRYFQPDSSLSGDDMTIMLNLTPEGAECAGLKPEALPSDVLVTRKPLAKWLSRLALLCIGIAVALNYPPDAIRTNKWVSLFQVQKSPRSQIGNISVSDQTSAWESGVKSGTDGTEIHAATSDTSDSFMQRPVRVGTFQWEVGTALYAEFNPWRVFFEDPRVMNRVAHFRNLRATLHVELLVNGNPFYYGRGIMSYIPLPDSDQISIFRSTTPEDLVEASQRPHIYFNPTTCEGGTVTCPFVFPKTQLDIVRREWRKMGLITLKSMNTLRHANGGTEPITITVLVHATELQLNTPTSILPLNLVPQGGDEYGMVSKPAMLVSRAASVLSQIPVIGRFAKATGMIANLTAQVAMIFGYSRPAIVLEQGMITRHFGSPATVNSVDTSLSMALDSKKEVTIDPSACGMASDDDMAFAGIVTRESFVDTFEWSENDTSDRHLYSIRINPMNGLLDDLRHAHITPAGLVAMCFDYWTGSMEVRLQIISSAYHRGRLRIVWDPEYVKEPGVYNVSYSTLIDITECTDMTFKIGWGQEFDYLRVPRLKDYLPGLPRSAQPGVREITANGTLSVYVVNGLTSPADDSTVVDVNVFTKMCDDFQVASPTSYNLDFVRLVRNPFRIPEDLDVKYSAVLAQKVIGSNGVEPARIDEELKSGSIQLLPDGPRRFRYITYANYAGVQDTALVVNYNAPGNGNLQLNWQDKTLEYQTPNGLTSKTLQIAVEPGWNYVDFTYESNTDALDLMTIQSGIPVSNAAVTIRNQDLVNRIPGSSLASYAPDPTVKFAFYDGPENSLQLSLYDAVVGTQASITLTRPSNVEGSTQRIADLDLPPGAARVYTFMVPIDKKITLSKSSVASPWVMKACALTYIQDLNYLAPEVGEVDVSDGTVPESTIITETMGSLAQPANMNDIYFGELIGSFRPLLKRYLLTYYWDMPDGTTPTSYVDVVFPHYPTTVVQTSGPGWVFSSSASAFTIVSSAFVCMRGSMRVKMLSNRQVIAANAIKDTWFFSRLPIFRRYLYQFNRTYEGGPLYTNARYKGYRLDGSVADACLLKPGPEIELPYYSQYKFTSPRTSADYRPADFIVESQYLAEPCVPATNAWVSVNYAAGEDFSLAFFLSTPELQFV